jgi:hypothetical protein
LALQAVLRLPPDDRRPVQRPPRVHPFGAFFRLFLVGLREGIGLLIPRNRRKRSEGIVMPYRAGMLSTTVLPGLALLDGTVQRRGWP